MPARTPIELRIEDGRVTLKDPAAVPERVRCDLEKSLERVNRDVGPAMRGDAVRLWPLLRSLLDW